MRREGMFYEVLDKDIIACGLCPHNCKLKEGQKGICGVRSVVNNRLESSSYGEISSIALDPIEKKPLYHYRPGKNILSVGSYGCNFRCGFCQNHQISMNTPDTQYVSPEELIEAAEKAKVKDSIGIAFTYNEPTIWYEYIFDVARLSQGREIDIILVTNGYIRNEPLQEILPYISAMNIDLKSFSEKYYRDVCHGSIDDVMETIELASSGCHVEIATLLVNGYNDSPGEVERLSKWIASIRKDIPLHLTRYYPAYKFKEPATPVERVLTSRDNARQNLDYVYVGNISGVDLNTYCPNCKSLLIEREGYKTRALISDNLCPKCNNPVNIVI